jgi:ribosome-associated toxin RatA of RatAB toxin-antitoxin module
MLIAVMKSVMKSGAIALLPLLLAIALPVISPASAGAMAQTLAQDVPNRDALQAGEAVVSGTEGNYVGQVIVDVPAEIAWEVLTDYDNFENFLPGIASSRLLVREGNQTIFEQVNEVRVAFISRRSRVRIATNETFPQRIAFQLVEGEEVESVEGSWQIDPVGEAAAQVMITHRVAVDPGGDDRGLFFNVYRNNLRDTLNALKREMERRVGS